MNLEQKRAEYCAALNNQYYPCDTGLHVCGINDHSNSLFGPHFTLLNLPLSSTDALAVFEKAKLEFECSEDREVFVDLMINGDILENFFIRRQMVEVMEKTLCK